MDQGSTLQQLPTQTTAPELSAPWQSSKLELEAHGQAQRQSQQWRQQARQRSLTRTGKLELEAHGPAQRHSQQWKTTGQAEITYKNWHSKPLIGPATPRRWRLPARRSTPAICRARAHAPKHGNNTRPTRLGCTPLRPLHPRRHSLRPPGRPSDAQCHSLQRRQLAQQTIDTANHRPAQQLPCGRDSRPGKLHLSKPTPPLCSPLCRHCLNNTATDNIQTSRSNNGVHGLFTVFGSLKGRLR
jgi:hypothetical protein